MARAKRRAIVVALGSAVSIACLTSFPDLRDGPAANDAGADVLIEAGGPCEGGGKLCGETCAPSDDPAFGCAGSFCNPCQFTNAVAKCSGGVCALAQCSAGFDDCDGAPENGCESDLAADPAHCGRCGHDCGGGACTAGVCQRVIIAADQKNPWSVEVDATHVYWTSAGGTVQLARLAHDAIGQPPEQLFVGAGAEGDLALDDTHVYWADEDAGLVRRLSKQSLGTPQTAGTGIGPSGIVLDDTFVYWTNQGAVPATDGSVSRAPKSGGSATAIASGLDSPWMMAADSTHVYWTSLRAGTVHRVAKTGGTPQQLATPVDSTPPLVAAWGIVVHAGFVYWRENDLLRRVPVGGGNTETLLAAKPNGRFVAIDGDQLLWTAHVPALQTIETATVSELAAAQVTIVSTAAGIAPHGAAIDSTFLYWTDWGTGSTALDGAVYKIARP